jgi:hypothetical protein
MLYLFLIILVSVFSGLIFMNQKMKKSKNDHKRKIEQLRIKVVELAEKQLVLKEKVEMAGWFQESNNSNFEKLNKDISGLFDLLMKMIETNKNQKGKT